MSVSTQSGAYGATLGLGTECYGWLVWPSSQKAGVRLADLPRSKVERIFVIRKLEALGFDVVSMETDCRNGFAWQRWSQNQAGQCGLFIFLFGNRIGTPGQELLAVC